MKKPNKKQYELQPTSMLTHFLGRRDPSVFISSLMLFRRRFSTATNVNNYFIFIEVSYN